MKPGNTFLADMLDLDASLPEATAVWRAGRATAVREENGAAHVRIPFHVLKSGAKDQTPVPDRELELRVRAYSNDVVRLSITAGDATAEDDSPMLSMAGEVAPLALVVTQDETGWQVKDRAGHLRMAIHTQDAPIQEWSKLIGPPPKMFEATVYPDGRTPVPFNAHDRFFPAHSESVALGFVSDGGRATRMMYSLSAAPNERFAGTGERFARMDLAGRTMVLENTDGLGTNSRRTYKNVPFYLSSRPYGLFLHTSAVARLSLADVSTRAAQAVVDEPSLDLFFIGGGRIDHIVRHYCELTGFPSEPPLWSYGTWMSRMTYFSADEVRSVARRMREGEFPCDVLHLDTGWFEKDWICEWRFSKKNFPDPAGFMQEMRDQGFRITLWQTPNVSRECCLFEEAAKKRYLAPLKGGSAGPGSDFSEMQFAGQIDFSNPDAVRWYQGLLENLLRMGASAIKTDFGEDITRDASYATVPYERLRNLYALLYQRAAFEVTKRTTGDGIIWARAGWAGCQRYPLHWGGDAACTWDGMAGSLRGGLHLGLSGFGFWSHDVPGFHGVPDFMNSWPADDLYVRWTQFGVFTSHLRYHGTSPREPYEYPAVADVVRKWLRLRYALIPYVLAQAKKVAQTGLPVLRALVFHHEDDPVCWHVDDEYYFGDDFLVAPIMNSEGRRDVYLPRGQWVDLWTAKSLAGGQWVKAEMPLERMPVYVRAGAVIPVYPERVQCTDEMDLSKTVGLSIDGQFRGLSGTVLGAVTGL